MSTYNSIAWLPLCAGLTGLGLVASWFAYRRRGLGSGLRGVAWSLLPLAIYLTGSIEMFWKIGTAIGDFAASFVLSPKVWSGVGVAALAALLFVVSGPAKRRRRRRTAAEADATRPAAGAEPGAAGQPGQPGQEKAAGSRRARKSLEPAPARAAKSGPADDDMREVEEILRRRGIN
jgi:hypothetical protein